MILANETVRERPTEASAWFFRCRGALRQSNMCEAVNLIFGYCLTPREMRGIGRLVGVLLNYTIPSNSMRAGSTEKRGVNSNGAQDYEISRPVDIC
jgi:hypothetical protein